MVIVIVISFVHREMSVHSVLSFSLISCSIFSRLAPGGTSTRTLHELLLMVHLNDG